MKSVKYDKLFLLLRIRDIKGTELIRGNIISAPTIIKLKHGENVNTDVLVRLCNYLGCALSDVCEYAPDELPSSDDVNPDVPFC